MPGSSSTTTVVGIRLKNDTLDTIRRRCSKSGETVSSHLRRRIEYDTTRKHHKPSRKLLISPLDNGATG